MSNCGNDEYFNNKVEDRGIPNGSTMAPHALEVVNQVYKRSLASPRRGNDSSYDPPAFYEQLDNELVVEEGEPLHLSTRVGPADDSSLQINWYKDGKLLSAGSRFSTIVDRGFIVLDIHYTIEDDVGEYVCVAVSQSGSAESNACRVVIVPENQIQYQTTLPEEMTQGITNINEQVVDKHAPKTAPKFLSQWPGNITLNQGEPLHIELTLEYQSDASLSTEWFKDGQSLVLGSRINMIYERGFCALDIAYCHPEDNGRYTCVARNLLGQVESEPVQLIVYPEDSIITKSNLTESSISQLKSLENPGDEYSSNLNVSTEPIAPSFTSVIEPRNISVSEGTPVHVEVTIDRGNDDKMTVNWYHNGEVIQTSSRITAKLEMNTAFLTIQHTLPIDSGSYICALISEYGSSQSDPVTMHIQQERSIILDPQSKNINAIQALEAELNAPKTQTLTDDLITDWPSFTRHLNDIGQINEGDSVSMMVEVEPANDNTLHVEWYKDDNQLINGSRMRIEYSCGTAKLTITSAISEDSGDYWCKAINRNGETDSGRVNLVCIEGERIVTASHLLEDSEGYRRLKEIEEIANMSNNEFRHNEDVQEDSPPNFDVKPMNITAGEGGPAKFLVKVSGFPSPVLEWKIDGVVVVPDSICKTYNDGSINYLEINRCNDLGELHIHVTATNPYGNAEAECTLTVVPMVDFRPDLRHILPENPYKKMANLKKVECSSELSHAFQKSKPTAETIIKIETGGEIKSKNFKSSDVIETEKLYDQVAAGLRKNLVGGNGARSPRNVHSRSPPTNNNDEMPPPPPFIME